LSVRSYTFGIVSIKHVLVVVKASTYVIKVPNRIYLINSQQKNEVTQIYVTSEEEMDSPESKSVDQLIYISDEKNDFKELKRAENVKKEIGNSSSAKNRHRNRVDVAEFRKASEEDLRSAKGVRRLRKKVSFANVTKSQFLT
jgi:hypothetical protein